MTLLYVGRDRAQRPRTAGDGGARTKSDHRGKQSEGGEQELRGAEEEQPGADRVQVHAQAGYI